MTAPLGFKEHYQTNEWTLMGAGDILLLHTDGLTEHAAGDVNYFPDHLEEVLRRVKHQSAREIYDAILDDLLRFATPQTTSASSSSRSSSSREPQKNARRSRRTGRRSRRPKLY